MSVSLHRVIAAVVAVIGFVTAAACGSSRAPEPLRLDGNLLTVYNSSSQDWTDVRIFLNDYYRVVTPTIAAHGQFKAPLDVFVEAYGRRFDFNRTQIRAVKLTATLPDGKPLELNKPFEVGGLAGALGGKR